MNKTNLARVATLAAMAAPGAEGYGYAAPAAASAPELDLDDDTPLPPACDLSGEGTCESCQ